MREAVRVTTLPNELEGEKLRRSPADPREALTDKVLEKFEDRCILASYFVRPSANLFKPETESHFGILDNPISDKVNDFLINTNDPVTVFSNLTNFRDIKKNLNWMVILWKG